MQKSVAERIISATSFATGLLRRIGYARVSTDDQDLTRQRTTLQAAECERIFEEKVSGAVRARPQLEAMLGQLRAGDVVTVTRLDRLARSTRDLLDISERLSSVGSGLRSLAEPWADTTTPAGRMVLTIFAGIAEFERSLIAERTGEGRTAARARGVRFGRPPALGGDQVRLVKRLRAEGMSAREIAASLGVHRSTIHRLEREKS